MASRQNQTRNRIFQCRDFARDTGTSVRLRLVQASPTDSRVLRRCVLTFTPREIYRRHAEQSHDALVSVVEASRMADLWRQENF